MRFDRIHLEDFHENNFSQDHFQMEDKWEMRIRNALTSYRIDFNQYHQNPTSTNISSTQRRRRNDFVIFFFYLSEHH